MFSVSGPKERALSRGSFIVGILSMLLYSMSLETSFPSSASEKHKGILLSYGSTSKWSCSITNVPLHIRCAVAFSVVVNTPARLVVHQHHFDHTKMHPTNWSHSSFQIFLNSSIEWIMWDSQRMYLLNKCCDAATHGSYLMQKSLGLLTHFVRLCPCQSIIGTLWHDGGGINLPFAKFLFHDLNEVQHVISLHLMILNKFGDDLTWGILQFPLTYLIISNILSPIYSTIIALQNICVSG